MLCSCETYCNCGGKMVKKDIGIGSYEYWGYKGFDSKIIYACKECDCTANDECEYCKYKEEEGVEKHLG